MKDAFPILHDHKLPLRELSFVSPIRILDSGSHRPLVCELEGDDEYSLWVVKTATMYHGSSLPLLSELVGADLFAMLGLPPPRAALLRLPQTAPESDDSDVGRYAAQILAKDAGTLAFCSAFIPAPSVQQGGVPTKTRIAQLIEDAVTLFFADRFLWHGDRTRGNPNCLSLQRRLIPVDHDRVLARLNVIDDTGLGYDFGDDPLADSARDHFAFELVQKHRKHSRWEAVAGLLGDIPSTMTTLVERWPTEWDRNPHGGSTDFLHQIQRFLLYRSERVLRILESVRP